MILEFDSGKDKETWDTDREEATKLFLSSMHAYNEQVEDAERIIRQVRNTSS